MVVSGVMLTMLGGIGWAGAQEMRTSRLQARLLSWFAEGMSFSLKEGPAVAPWFPKSGPYNERLGYAGLPTYIKNLTGNNFAVEMQAQMSSRLETFVAAGGFAIYDEKTRAGLTLLDRNGDVMYQARFPERTYTSFAEIPPLVVQTLLFIENRELLDDSQPKRNPAVEWDRFTYALAGLPLQWINPGMRIPGGSTLATQIEKYRHSPDGQTHGAIEKLRQMMSASVRAYMSGEETGAHRRQIAVNYLNSTPLTARAGFGEVNGLGDGLYAWFNTDFQTANRVLSEPAHDARSLQLKALAYKQVLSLMLAQRRPSYYLIQNRKALNKLADSHLRVLADAGVVDEALRDAALGIPLRFRSDAPEPAQTSFVEQKAPNAIRARLMTMMGLSSLYQLDRIDLTAQSTLDTPTQQRVVEVLRRLGDPAYVQELQLTGDRLLQIQKGDPSKVIYSVTLFEKGADANYVRVQADNLDQPLDINEMAKLDLGSTAKFRTLVTYLEVIAELHGRYAHVPPRDLQDVSEDANDPLTKWATKWLSTATDRSLQALLNAAMDRKYSGNPGEMFFTGGGLHSFVNFDNKFNGSILSVTDSLRNSVNLPFIRMMRDIVQFHIAEGADDKGDLLTNPDHPLRQEYLARFADKEGSEFLNRFFNDYHGRTPDEALALLASRARPAPHRLAVIFRYVRTDAGIKEFAAFLHGRLPTAKLDDKELAHLYEKYGPDKFPLNDLGYIAGVHPLQLWLVGHLQKNPGAKRKDVLAASTQERLDSYSWLFKKGLSAQNTRIRIALEEEAFAKISRQWRRLGYPFDTLVPSLATAIGSSADRPAALADLMGIMVNDGVRQPTVRITRLHFAEGTPYETVIGMGPQPAERVLPPEIPQTVRKALMQVVESGTAKRVHGAFIDSAGNLIPIGGKTGTGDHRFERFGPGGVVLESRAVNRTATFVFFIGDRFFGTVTAFVHGEEADHYKFTSALPAQLLKSLAPALQPLIDQPTLRTAETANGPAGL